MDYKHKHLKQLKKGFDRAAKTAVLSTVAAVTLSGCSEERKENGGSGDMLSRSEITDKDIGGNDVVLKKIEITLCDENKKPTGIKKLSWGLDNQPRVTRDEKTYATPFYSGPELSYVETYKDGVLKEFPDMIVLNGQLQVVGDKKTYAVNLLHVHEQQAEENRAKALAKSLNRKVQKISAGLPEETSDSLAAAADTIPEIRNDSVQVGIVSGQYHEEDSSVVKDTLKRTEIPAKVIETVVKSQGRD